MSKRILAKNSLILGSHYAIQSVLPIIIYPLASQSLGFKEFGIITSTLSIANFGLVLVNFTFNVEGIQWISRDQNNEKAILKSIINAKIFLFFPAFTFTAFFIFFIINPPFYIYIFAFNLIFVGILNNSWYLQFKEKFFEIFLISFLSITSTFLISFFIKEIEGTNGNLNIYILLIFPSLISGLFGTFYIYKINNFFKEKFKKFRLLKLLRNKFILFSSQLVAMGYGGTGVFLISQFDSFESAGEYAVIEKLFFLLPIIGGLPYQTSIPKLSKLYFEDNERYKHLITKLIMIYFFISLFILIIIFSFNKFINLYASFISNNLGLCFLFSILTFLAILGPVITSHYLLARKNKLIFKINCILLLTSLFIGIPFIKYFSTSGWVLALIISQSIVLIPKLKDVYKN